MRKRTNAEFLELMKEVNPNIIIESKYIDSNTKVDCKCKIDNYKWKARPLSLLRNVGCPKCAGNIKKTHEEFIDELYKINPNVKVLEKYINRNTKIKCKCLIHNYDWYILPSDLLSGYGCPICGKHMKKDKNTFVQQMKLINPNIKIIGDYINARTKIKCKCKLHNKIWDITPDALLRGQGCPDCKLEKLKISNAEFLLRLKENNNNVLPLEEYKGMDVKMKCKCLKCGNEWEVEPHSLLAGHRCPNCNNYKGELKINKYLHKQAIIHNHQFSYEDCRDRIPLRFDFYLPDYNCCIEYQGIQHYEPIDFAGKGKQWAEELFKQTRRKDNIKRKYCKTHNINLFEIPYWSFDDIDIILSNYLSL